MGTGRFVKLFGADGTDQGVVEQADEADKRRIASWSGACSLSAVFARRG
jgi:hypothetical protein